MAGDNLMLIMSPEQYREFIIATAQDEPDLYRRLMLLWNAGCRGADLAGRRPLPPPRSR